jgi:hypothetical protein
MSFVNGRVVVLELGYKGQVHVSAIYFQHGAKYSLARGVLESSEVLQELAEQVIIK